MLKDEDLRIDTYRNGGITVRITHIPTKLSATCNSYYTEYQNKAAALADLDEKVRNHEDSNDAA